MKLFIKVFTNRILSLEVKGTESVYSVKKKIHDLERIPISHQRLFHVRLELDDIQLLSYYNLPDVTTLTCESSVLLAILPDGELHVFDVNPSDVVQKFKQVIEEKCGIPQGHQRFFYSCCSFRGRQLDDAKTVFENKIGGNLIHVLEAKRNSQLFIEILDSTRRIVNIQVNFTDTILNVKKKLQESSSNNIMHYKLFYHDNKLADNKSLAHYGIKNEIVLQLCENKIIFISRLSSEKNKILVDLSDTTNVIKDKIEQELGIPTYYQILSFHGRKLENSKTLAEYDIGYGMKVELQAGVRVSVISSYKNMTFDILRDYSIQTLKEDIKKELGVPEEYQRLFSSSQELFDTYHGPCSGEMTDKLTLLTTTGNIIIVLVFFESSLHFVKSSSTDKIKSIRGKLANDVGKSLNEYSFFQGFQILKEDFKIKELKRENCFQSAHLKLELIKNADNLFPLFVLILTGKKFEFMVTASDTINTLKYRIAVREGLPVNQQRLFYARLQLQDDWKIGDYNIRPKDTIGMAIRLRGC